MKISILSAVQNEELHLWEMVESVIRQTHNDWELLLADDRSTDDTREIIRIAAGLDQRIINASRGNTTGKNSAWNQAYARSTGDAIVFLAGDDRLPTTALADRIRFVQDQIFRDRRIVAYSKVRMFSEDKRFDGLVVPRGGRGSRSGGTTLMSRSLADVIFPIAEILPNEDLWVSEVASLRSERQIEAPCVALEYRIHRNNSFRRDVSFEKASQALNARGEVYELLANEARFGWSDAELVTLQRKMRAEHCRRSGNVLKLLWQPGLPLSHRLRLAAQANRILYSARQRSYSLFSGW